MLLAPLAVGLALALPVVAAPWIAPGDSALRDDIELLVDAGVIRAPVTTWPLSWGDIAGEVLDVAPNPALAPYQQLALQRMQRRARAAIDSGERRRELRLAMQVDPRKLRTFEDTPRETAEATAAVGWTGLAMSYRLEVTGVTGPDDGRRVRLDGTHVGLAVGNLMISAGLMDRWWGPGRDGSLILSSNARPIPALAVQRNDSTPFSHRFLRWIGPWTATFVAGVLEGGRAVPDPGFLGFRFNFRPLDDLEIGLSRTAIWCGEDRPCSLSTFADLLLGRDNRGDNVTVEEEPSNQLAALDWRWASPIGNAPWAFYGQFVGEDEAGGLPSRYIGMAGLETWGATERLDATYRLYLELTDTTAEFYKDTARFDFAYEHDIYTSGYRYRGRSIGHAMDNDGRMASVGASLRDASGAHWRALLRFVELNTGGSTINRHSVSDEPADIVNLELGHTRPFLSGRLDLTFGYDRLEPEGAGPTGDDLRGSIQWRAGL